MLYCCEDPIYVDYLAVTMSDAAKFCLKCVAEVPSRHSFCFKCGNALFLKSEFDAEKEIDQPQVCASGSSSSSEKGNSKSDEALGGVIKISDDDDHSVSSQSGGTDSQLKSDIQKESETREFNEFHIFW